MPRVIVAIAMALALGSAVFLYAVKYDARRIEAQLQDTERAIEAARNDIAVLEAERAHLSRPERIAPLARAIGMRPPEPHQIVSGGRAAGAGAPRRAEPGR